MPFIYTPSIYGFAGALIFLILALVSFNSAERELSDCDSAGDCSKLRAMTSKQSRLVSVYMADGVRGICRLSVELIKACTPGSLLFISGLKAILFCK